MDHRERIEKLAAQGAEDDLSRHIIQFDPRAADHYLFAAAPDTAAAVEMAAAALRPEPIPWPQGLAPTPARPADLPLDTDPLPSADVLVVTYTVAESYALADVLTPGWDTSAWTAYRNGWQELKPTIAHGAPSLAADRAGLWATTRIGNQTVVVVKSDLHPSTDGHQLPIRRLWKQMIAQTTPKLVITTGTAGGVGADVLLGDVIVSRTVRWDATLRFADQPWAHTVYNSDAAVAADTFATVTQTLIPANTARLPAAARPPQVFLDSEAAPAHTITTDFFAFDDAADHYGLRADDPQARAVEMDDAALALACSDLRAAPGWLSIRNASDPQMNSATLAAEKKQAAAIYEKYGYWTSIGSVIACWAVIAHLT